MNPGYAGRTELPDNLKVLFRPVSMMIPDYGLIAEIMLFAEGFENASSLSKKMVQLYRLASEQLSQQDHYDFGMRAVKSVLVMAGVMKRANTSLSEELVIIRAMMDSNVPKFLKDDLMLFVAIINDLFPALEIKRTANEELEAQARLSTETLKLQPVPLFLDKVFQLAITLDVRLGVMLTGATASGKTECIRVLEDTLTQLRRKESTNVKFQEVKTHFLNPKCISMNELYGQVNPYTQEWQDGLASSLIRTATGEESAAF